MMRDHGGNLDWAMQQFGGAADGWIDLSTGINRMPYPVGPLSDGIWKALPTHAEIQALERQAGLAYGSKMPVLALAGAQAAIQLMPRLATPGLARILSPTYNEHAAAFAAAGWQVKEVSRLDDLEGAQMAVVVNPNNPDGCVHEPQRLLSLAARVGRLVVDESFADPLPGVSLAAQAGQDGLLVLRSFGKFYGLAGLRLGFVLGSASEIAACRAMAGPWPVSGAAITVGCTALADSNWRAATTARLLRDANRLDALVAAAGCVIVGGTPLFRLYQVEDAGAIQRQLARAQIWSRIFPAASGWLRLGLPGKEDEWDRLAAALAVAP